jgi:FAD/FMN-containing dehydrogenase
MSTAVAAAAAARDLSAVLDPARVLLPGPAYDKAVRIWNGAVAHRPALIARCETPAEVQAAVGTARARALALSVLGGGHNWAGWAVRDGGLLIDLAGMRQVTVDAPARVATVAGGATEGDVIATTSPHGLAAVTGTVGTVGMAGLTLGGGYSPLSGRFGLALDNLVGAEVVLADGRLVTADAAHEPDLFWALRGGGGNFGVVTAMRVRLHPVSTVIAGFILFPWSEAAQVMRGYADLMAAAPDEFSVQVGVLSGPDGGPTLYLLPTWSGEAGEGERAVAELQRLGTPLQAEAAPRSYGDLLGLYDAYFPAGRHYAIRTRSVARITPEVISALDTAGATRTSPLSAITITQLHGAATRVPVESTAFGNRQGHFVVEIVPAWEPDDRNGARHRAWADALSAALAPVALPGGYPNLLGPDDHDQIAEAYGPNTARLLAIKQRYDPDGFFSATPLPANADRGSTAQRLTPPVRKVV